MPVITLYKDLFSSFVGKPLTVEDMLKWLPWLGVDIEESGLDYVKVEFNPNRVDFSSHAGVARAFSGHMGWETGLPRYEVNEGDITLNVNSKTSKVRPYVLGAVIRDLKLEDESLREIIEMQEDLHWGIGRNRKKASIGLHNFDAVQPPFGYITGKSNVRFIPLDREEEMSIHEILNEHEKGKMYRHLVKGVRDFPLIVDSNEDILSFPPLINSELTRVSSKTKNLFIDVTGPDFDAIERCLNILVTTLADMGGYIESVKVIYPNHTIVSPNLEPQKMELRVDYASKLLGLRLSEDMAIRSLKKCRLDAKSGKNGVLEVSIPAYRIDVMHEVDLVEEVALGYGFYRLKPTVPATVTTGKRHEVGMIANYARQIMIGLGYLEVMNFYLTNEADQYVKMRRRVGKVIRLANPVSEEYSIVRGDLLSSLMKNLANNRHESYPQRIFEVSDVLKINFKRDTRSERRIHVAGASCHAAANFTEIKSISEALLNNLGVVSWEIKETRHPSFISGRVAAIYIKRRGLGVVGEVHPEVLNNFELENPISVFEIDLEEILKKRRSKGKFILYQA